MTKIAENQNITKQKSFNKAKSVIIFNKENKYLGYFLSIRTASMLLPISAQSISLSCRGAMLLQMGVAFRYLDPKANLTKQELIEGVNLIHYDEICENYFMRYHNTTKTITKKSNNIESKIHKRHFLAKAVLVFDEYYKLVGALSSARAAEFLLGISAQTISYVCRGMRLSSCGFYFRYLESDTGITRDELLGGIDLLDFDNRCGNIMPYNTTDNSKIARRKNRKSKTNTEGNMSVQ